MLYINLNGGGKSHILSEVIPGPEGRIVSTVCGQTHPEEDFYGTEDDSNVCARCAGRVDLEPEVDKTPVDDVESTPEPEAEKPKSSKK